MFTIDDCYLVRKTNIFPEHGVITSPINARAYSFDSSSILGLATRNKILSEMDIKEYNSDILDKVTEQLNKYKVYFETYRRTLHFTINGVVQDSLYGNFDYPIAIIEPLKHHIDDPNLIGLRVEDTYFVDDFELSTDSIVFIPEGMEVNGINGLNIITYTGNLDEAIKSYFDAHNMPFFEVNNHGYTHGLEEKTPDYVMYDMINRYAEEHGVSQERHFNSQINYEDSMMRNEKAKETDLKHLEYILKSGYVPSELVENIESYLDYEMFKPKELDELLEQMINILGLDRLEQLTIEFNNIMIEERNNSIKNSYH